jgi:hypothetical protein
LTSLEYGEGADEVQEAVEGESPFEEHFQFRIVEQFAKLFYIPPLFEPFPPGSKRAQVSLETIGRFAGRNLPAEAGLAANFRQPL